MRGATTWEEPLSAIVMEGLQNDFVSRGWAWLVPPESLTLLSPEVCTLAAHSKADCTQAHSCHRSGLCTTAQHPWPVLWPSWLQTYTLALAVRLRLLWWRARGPCLTFAHRVGVWDVLMCNLQVDDGEIIGKCMWVGCKVQPRAKQPPPTRGRRAQAAVVPLEKETTFPTEEAGTSWEFLGGRCTAMGGWHHQLQSCINFQSSGLFETCFQLTWQIHFQGNNRWQQTDGSVISKPLQRKEVSL